MKFSMLQLAKLTLILILLVIAPFISGSLRISYVYFLLNILILVLGLESGLIGVRQGSSEDKKNIVPIITASVESLHSSTIHSTTHSIPQKSTKCNISKPVIEKIVQITPPVKKIASVSTPVKKSPSRPSLFFIGSFEEEDYHRKEEDSYEEENTGEISGHELFFKAEAFIGNFYKQLKMQREESWKKIHGFYKKAF